LQIRFLVKSPFFQGSDVKVTPRVDLPVIE